MPIAQLIQVVLDRKAQLTDAFRRAMPIAQLIQAVLDRKAQLTDAFRLGGRS